MYFFGRRARGEGRLAGLSEKSQHKEVLPDLKEEKREKGDFLTPSPRKE